MQMHTHTCKHTLTHTVCSPTHLGEALHVQAQELGQACDAEFSAPGPNVVRHCCTIKLAHDVEDGDLWQRRLEITTHNGHAFER
jgi:hypothetical protein